MNRLPTYKPDEVIRKLQKAGFDIDHITGSHISCAILMDEGLLCLTIKGGT